MTKITKEFKEFEKKFGFEAYEGIKKIMARQHERIKQLEKSRDNWKDKYFNSIKGGKN